jgi:hypothetical protein
MSPTAPTTASRPRRRDLVLSELAQSSLGLSDGLASIAGWLERGGRAQAMCPEPSRVVVADTRRRRGRPPRAATISPALLAAAPVPELLLTPADRVGPVIRAIDDPELLRSAYDFERANDARKTVIGGIRQRLRLLGEPLTDAAK